MRRRALLALLATALLAGCADSSRPAQPAHRAIAVRPGDDLFARLAELRPGDRVTVHSGTYRTPGYLNLRWRGTAKAPIAVSGAPGERPPVIVGPADQNVINLAGTHFTLAGLEIRGGGHGLRLGNVSDATLTRLVVDRVGDVGISCNRPGQRCRRVTVSRSRVSATGTQGTPGEGMYFGCQDAGCSFTRGRIVDNVVHDTGGSDGDGIELKPGSTANLVRGNVVCRTVGRGLHIWDTRNTVVKTDSRACARAGIP